MGKNFPILRGVFSKIFPFLGVYFQFKKKKIKIYNFDHFLPKNQLFWNKIAKIFDFFSWPILAKFAKIMKYGRKYGRKWKNMEIWMKIAKYGKIWKIWIWKSILEASNQAKNVFFVHFRTSQVRKKNMDFHERMKVDTLLISNTKIYE